MKHNERARVAPLYLTLTHPFRTQKIHERPPAAGGGLRRPAATACGFSSRSALSPPPLNAPRCRSPRYRPSRCRSPRCRSPRCLLAAACGRLTLRAAARPRRRFHRDQRSARRRSTLSPPPRRPPDAPRHRPLRHAACLRRPAAADAPRRIPPASTVSSRSTLSPPPRRPPGAPRRRPPASTVSSRSTLSPPPRAEENCTLHL